MKKIIVMLLALLPMTMFAQAKFGHCNTSEIMQSMPEFSIARGEMEAKAKEYDNEYKLMQDEFARKLDEYQKGESTMAPTKKEEMEAELTQMQQKLQQAAQDYQQQLQQYQQEKMQPLYAKLQNAIQTVGKTGGYVYIMDLSMGLPYISDTLSEDVTTKVKAELSKLK